MRTFPKILITILMAHTMWLGCASEMPGTDAVEISPPQGQEGELQLSLDDMKDLSSDHYRAFQVSFKNDSDRWVRFEKLNIAFPELKEQPDVLLGKDLETYVASIGRRNTVESHNRELALGSIYTIGTLGALGGSMSGNRGVAAVGAGAALGSLTYGAVTGLNDSKNKAQFHNTLPDNHLIKPFDIPPHMVVARWIIIKAPTDPWREVQVEATEIQQPKRNFVIELERRKPFTKSAHKRPASH